MTRIIAYGTVVRAPINLTPSCISEDRSIGFSIVVDEDLRDELFVEHRRALYRLIVDEDVCGDVLLGLRAGSSVLIQGELFGHYPEFGDRSSTSNALHYPWKNSQYRTTS